MSNDEVTIQEVKAIRQSRCCKKCYYWWRHLKKTEGHCIRHAPKEYVDRDPLLCNKMWPKTFEYESCGEFESMREVIDIFYKEE